MNTTHTFTPSVLNKSLCAQCYRAEDLHGKVECESCNQIGVLTLLNKMWLCADCVVKENTADTVQAVPIQPVQPAEEINRKIATDHRPAEIEHAAINRLGSQSIGKSTDFFNARTGSIATRWLEISSDESISKEEKHYQLAKEVREHYLHMKSVLFQAVELQLECASNQRADQSYLNQLASKLREEQRVQLHLANIDYTPPTPKAPAKVKVSKDDQIAAFYAQRMGIPLEQAKRLLDNKLKEVVGECTCKETPGICRVHHST